MPDDVAQIAAYNLGVVYAHGDLAPKDDREAERWLKISADRGYVRATAALGELLVQRAAATDQRPVDLYSKSVAKGVPEATVNLGVLYLDGKWVPRDDAKAADWFHKAAEKGEPAAQTELGIMYLLGRGVGHDDNEAVKWLRKAADQNFTPAMNLLGKLYATGRGVEKDPMRALAINARIPAAERMDDGKVILSLTEPVRIMRLEMHHGMLELSAI
jgi:TPR repeat protein